MDIDDLADAAAKLRKFCGPTITRVELRQEDYDLLRTTIPKRPTRTPWDPLLGVPLFVGGAPWGMAKLEYSDGTVEWVEVRNGAQQRLDELKRRFLDMELAVPQDEGPEVASSEPFNPGALQDDSRAAREGVTADPDAPSKSS